MWEIEPVNSNAIPDELKANVEIYYGRKKAGEESFEEIPFCANFEFKDFKVLTNNSLKFITNRFLWKSKLHIFFFTCLCFDKDLHLITYLVISRCFEKNVCTFELIL